MDQRKKEEHHKSKRNVRIRIRIITGLYILEFSPPPVGGGKKIKRSGDGEGNLRGDKEKKRKFGENITFYSTKS